MYQEYIAAERASDSVHIVPGFHARMLLFSAFTIVDIHGPDKIGLSGAYLSLVLEKLKQFMSSMRVTKPTRCMDRSR